jgi:hypothetical protein
MEQVAAHIGKQNLKGKKTNILFQNNSIYSQLIDYYQISKCGPKDQNRV